VGKGPRDLLIRIEVKHLCGKATTSALVVKSDAGYANEYGYQFEVQVRDKLQGFGPVRTDCCLSPEDSERFGDDLDNDRRGKKRDQRPCGVNLTTVRNDARSELECSFVSRAALRKLIERLARVIQATGKRPRHPCSNGAPRWRKWPVLGSAHGALTHSRRLFVAFAAAGIHSAVDAA